MRIEAEGFLLKLDTFQAVALQKTTLRISLIPKPDKPSVTVREGRIVLRKQIHFETNSADISLDSQSLMSEIADALLRNPEILVVEIQGHTDNRGGRAHNKELSRRRADSVRSWLVNDGGVESNRLVAKGYGLEKPIVPNITAANRAKNRRVQFIIRERGAAQPAPQTSPPPKTESSKARHRNLRPI